MMYFSSQLWLGLWWEWSRPAPRPSIAPAAPPASSGKANLLASIFANRASEDGTRFSIPTVTKTPRSNLGARIFDDFLNVRNKQKRSKSYRAAGTLFYYLVDLVIKLIFRNGYLRLYTHIPVFSAEIGWNQRTWENQGLRLRRCRDCAAGAGPRQVEG